MAKKLFDLKNTKKVIAIVTIKCLIISLANIASLFIPINNTNCFDFLGLILEGAIKIDLSSAVRIAYYLITICMVIGFSCGILFKRKKSEINTFSISTIKNSAFAKIVIMDSIYFMFSALLSGMYFCLDFCFLSMDVSAIKENVVYIIYMLVFVLIYFILELSFVSIIAPARNFVNFGTYAKINVSNISESKNQTNADVWNERKIATNNRNLTSEKSSRLLNTLSKRYKIYGVLWIIIGIFQILSFWGAIVGIWNLYASYTNIKYSKKIKQNPSNIVASHTPVAKSVLLFIIQLVLGSVIGVVGSIYYFVAIRGFVMKNKDDFLAMENLQTNAPKMQMHSDRHHYSEDNNNENNRKTTLEKKENLDALVKYKKLYDSGAITQEEFLKKKAELLDE